MSMSSLGPDSSSIPANVDIPSHVRRHLCSELQAYYAVTLEAGALVDMAAGVADDARSPDVVISSSMDAPTTKRG